MSVTLEEIDILVKNEFSEHPFSKGISSLNVENVLLNLLAVSQAFPYIQAGSQGPLIESVLSGQAQVDANFEMTSVVGNFLSWDETGGAYILAEYGIEGLSKILDTDKRFHANILKRDIQKLLSKQVTPLYSPDTVEYLKTLFTSLSSSNAIERVAEMVAFEHHAGELIENLWSSLCELYDIPKEELTYFLIHVGGDNPAEVHHMEMTRSMISHTLNSPEDMDEFMSFFMASYKRNIKWSNAVKVA
ncbi:conserved hypothetical protein [Vibrio jasicida]|uniref:hypothetical protein n=1 Tax=Vibrio jasicida TaxID=766224 RepID=UPI00289473B2|nr:conserved hypothetical protein [Vibrio jasicida]